MSVEEYAEMVKDVSSLSLEYYKRSVEVTYKEDDSPLTEADRVVHRHLVSELSKTNIPVLSEEGNQEVSSTDGELWVIDPIDGTKDFIQGTDQFSTMVALVQDGVPIMGIVYAPALDELYFAEKGKGAYLQVGDKVERLTVSDRGDLADATLVVSRNHGSPEYEEKLEEIGVKKREKGSIGIKLGEIAKGDAEVYVNHYRKLGWWDVLAPQIILEEAGGKVTGLSGEVLRYDEPPYQVVEGVLASNELLHDSVLVSFNEIER